MVPQISAYLRAIRKHYDISFGWRLDENVDLIPPSNRQQMANGYASVMPFCALAAVSVRPGSA